MREESYKDSFKRIGKVLLATILFFGVMMAMTKSPSLPIINVIRIIFTVSYLGYILYLNCKPKS